MNRQAFNIEVPANRDNGDYSSNIAFVCAKVFRRAPKMIADLVAKYIELDGTYFDSCTVAGAGFVNFTLSKDFYADILLDVKALGKDYGRSDYGEGKKINVEFVSANPTGPMHMGNARGGALGDCLAGVLDYAGYEVTREFYVNDAGNQIEKLAVSLLARYKQIVLGEENYEFPEDGYHGDDVKEHAKNFFEKFGDSYIDIPDEELKAKLIDETLYNAVALWYKS